MRVGHRCHAFGRGFGEFANPIHNGDQGGQNFLAVVFRDGKSGESGELVEVLGVEVHSVTGKSNVCFIILFF